MPALDAVAHECALQLFLALVCANGEPVAMSLVHRQLVVARRLVALQTSIARACLSSTDSSVVLDENLKLLSGSCKLWIGT